MVIPRIKKPLSILESAKPSNIAPGAKITGRTQCHCTLSPFRECHCESLSEDGLECRNYLSECLRDCRQGSPSCSSTACAAAFCAATRCTPTVYADKVGDSKFGRSQPFRAAVEAGNIKLPRGESNEAFLGECEQFSPDPREYEHDDQVDAAPGAFNHLTAQQA